jgi:hypothetical protein
MLARSAKITIEIIEGAEILEQGHEVARHMWNFLCWCGVGFNRKMCWGDPLEEWDGAKLECKYKHDGERKWLGMKWPKWPGRFKIEKAFRDYWAAQELSDRCYSKVVQEFDIAMRSWFSNLKINRRARPPRYCKESRHCSMGDPNRPNSRGGFLTQPPRSPRAPSPHCEGAFSFRVQVHLFGW